MEGEVEVCLHPRNQLSPGFISVSLLHPGRRVTGLLSSGPTAKMSQSTTANTKPTAETTSSNNKYLLG